MRATAQDGVPRRKVGRPKGTFTHPERDARIAALYEQGLTYAQLGEQFALTPQRAQQIGSRFRVVSRRPYLLQARFTSEEDVELARLWRCGELSAALIGQKMGRSKNSIIGRAHRLHLPVKPMPTTRVA